MSESLIDNWLDNELDEESVGQFEEWLREDSDHLQGFFDAVKLQEDLRRHYAATPNMVTLPSRRRKRIRLMGWLSAAAAVLVTVFLVVPRESEPQPTADPLVWVLDGNPQIELARVEPGPSPAPIPREQWPVETRITISSESSALRWGEDCEFRGDPGTYLALRLASYEEPRSIRLKAGSLKVRLVEPAVAVDTLVGDSRIRTSQPAVFSIVVSESGSELSVIRGSVEVRFPDGVKRSVTPGEDVSLP